MSHHRKSVVASPSSSKSTTNRAGPPFDIVVLRDESTRVQGETEMTTKHVKGLVADAIQVQYSLKRSVALNSIASITPYIPVREEKIGDNWVAANVNNDHDTMANVFAQHHTGLFLFQLNEEFKSTHGSSQAQEIQTLREKTTASHKDLLERIAKIEAEAERSKAEAERSKAEADKLRADFDTERKRAQLAEENIADINSHIANGSREDTDSFYRIKVRHLVSLVQARLAYAAGWVSGPDERNGSFTWRNEFMTSTGLNSNKKKMAKALVALANTTGQDRANINGISKAAWKILVNDSDLRYAGDMEAHPGPLTNDNAEGYRRAVQAIGGKNVRALDTCITFLLCYAT